MPTREITHALHEYSLATNGFLFIQVPRINYVHVLSFIVATCITKWQPTLVGLFSIET